MASNVGEMTFWDHLEDLRMCIVRVALAFAGAALLLFLFKDFLFDDIVLAPSHSSFFLYRLLGIDFTLDLINIEVAAQFMIHMKVTFMCAMIVVFPYFIFELWRFVAPALYEKEKKSVRGAFAFASVLFYIGLAAGYFIVMPLMLNFFVSYQVSPDVVNTFSLSSYISLFTSTVLVFGLLFEFPTIAAVLSSLGILTKDTMRRYRKHAVCAAVILAALITPSGDPFSLLVVSVPLYILYEFSILLCRKGDSSSLKLYDIDK